MLEKYMQISIFLANCSFKIYNPRCGQYTPSKYKRKTHARLIIFSFLWITYFFLNHNRIEMGSTFVNIDIIHIFLQPSCWKFSLLIKKRNINHVKYFLEIFSLWYDLECWKTNLHVWYKNGKGLLSFKSMRNERCNPIMSSKKIYLQEMQKSLP